MCDQNLIVGQLIATSSYKQYLEENWFPSQLTLIPWRDQHIEVKENGNFADAFCHQFINTMDELRLNF